MRFEGGAMPVEVARMTHRSAIGIHSDFSGLSARMRYLHRKSFPDAHSTPADGRTAYGCTRTSHIRMFEQDSVLAQASDRNGTCRLYACS